ncbi:MAG: thioredoxin family protein [Lysinibacillus sp.]
MKKLLIFGSVIVVLFAAIIVLTMVSNKSKVSSDKNPYGDKVLDQATIDQLDDKNYQSIVLPDELKKKIAAGEDVNAYFFSPTCGYCQQFTPVLMPTAEKEGIEIAQINVLEYGEFLGEYNFTSTPTFIRFEDGKEVARFEGALKKEPLMAFFNEHILK